MKNKIIYLLGLFSKRVRRYTLLNGNYYWGLVKWIKDDYDVVSKDFLTEADFKKVFTR